MINLFAILHLGCYFSATSALILDGKVMVPDNYSLYHPPVSENNEKMEVFLDLVITDIIELDFAKSRITLNIEFVLSWKDELITIDPDLSGSVHLEDKNKIWVPDLYIYALKRIRPGKVLKNTESLTLEPDGTDNKMTKVTYFFEAETELLCPANYALFPFNIHSCEVAVGSWTKSTDVLMFLPDKAMENKVVKNITEFDYTMAINYLPSESTRDGVLDANAKFSVVGLKLQFQHKWERYIFLYYIPTMLIVITSWTFFLLPSTSYPSRTALLVTVFLLLINIFSGVVNDTPNTDNGTMTDLEMWTFCCIVSVFVSLVSYGIILVKDQMIIQGVIMNDEGDAVEFSPRNARKVWSSEKKEVKEVKKASIMEKTKKNVALEASLFSLVATGFIFFNVYYWTRSRTY